MSPDWWVHNKSFSRDDETCTSTFFCKQAETLPCVPIPHSVLRLNADWGHAPLPVPHQLLHAVSKGQPDPSTHACTAQAAHPHQALTTQGQPHQPYRDRGLQVGLRFEYTDDVCSSSCLDSTGLLTLSLPEKNIPMALNVSTFIGH